jgi:membrane protein CcdC involved in cytochrome C biogenesis
MEMLLDECLLLSIGDYACMSFLEAFSLPVSWRVRLLERLQEIKDKIEDKLPSTKGSSKRPSRGR